MICFSVFRWVLILSQTPQIKKRRRKRLLEINLFVCTESRPFHLFNSSLKADAREELRLTAAVRVEKGMREVKCFERSV